MSVRLDVLSIFPEYLAPLDLSLIGKARRDGLLDLRVHDLREFTHDRHRTVDDTPAGGFYHSRARHVDRAAIRTTSENNSPSSDLADLKRQLEKKLAKAS